MNVETIQITGLKIKAIAGATVGPGTAKIGPLPDGRPRGDDFRAFRKSAGTRPLACRHHRSSDERLLAPTPRTSSSRPAAGRPDSRPHVEAAFSDVRDPRNVTAAGAGA